MSEALSEALLILLPMVAFWCGRYFGRWESRPRHIDGEA